MNRSKKLCILLGVLAAVCGATLIALQLEEHQEKIRTSEEIILEVSSDSVQSLSWEYEGETLAFHKEDVWLYDEDSDFPVSEERILELLEPFQSFGVSFAIEDVEDYGQYGLDDPACTISLTAGDQSYQVLVGNYSNLDSKRYVSIGDGNVYLVQNDPLDYFDATLRSMIANDETPAFDHVTAIHFSGDESYSVIYEEDCEDTYSADDVYFAQTNGGKQPLDTSRVESYLWMISSMNPTNYVSYHADDVELAVYGMDSPDLTVTVEYTAEDNEGNEEAKSFVLHISQDPAEKEAAENAADNDGEIEVTSYARIGDSRIIYEISADRYESLMAAFYNDLRHTEVFWAEFEDVWQIDISLDGESHTFATEGKDGERTWVYQEEEVEISEVRSALEALIAEEFTSERPAQQEEIALTVYLENKSFPKVQIRLYRYDGERCLAVVDGESTALVSRDSVVHLMETIRAIVLK